jgi:hypothetical protein
MYRAMQTSFFKAATRLPHRNLLHRKAFFLEASQKRQPFRLMLTDGKIGEDILWFRSVKKTITFVTDPAPACSASCSCKEKAELG